MRLPACIAIFLLLLNGSVFAAETPWHDWSAQVLLQAQQENKLILLDLTADWCVFCQKMKRTTYRDSAVMDAINRHFIAVRADEARYPDLVKRFPHVGRPGIIFLDSQGNELLSKTGYLEAQYMLWMLQGVAAEFISTPADGT